MTLTPIRGGLTWCPMIYTCITLLYFFRDSSGNGNQNEWLRQKVKFAIEPLRRPSRLPKTNPSRTRLNRWQLICKGKAPILRICRGTPRCVRRRTRMA